MRLRSVRTFDDLGALDELFSVCHDADGHWPLGEHKYLDLVQGIGEESAGLVAETQDGIAGYAHVTRNRDHGGWTLELATHPLHRAEGVDEALVAAAIEWVREARGTSLRLWVFRPALSGVLRSMDFRQDRELRQLRRRLPMEATYPMPGGIALHPFRPGHDDADWLEVNNRAFAGHPENGAWTEAVLDDRKAQDWFDPEGFLVAWSGQRLVGFCWTKVHDGGVGEIYVIAVDPDHEGAGLGRALVGAGLAHLYDRRGCNTGMLYVDASNHRALRLYERMGFWVDHIDRAFILELEPEIRS